MSDKQPPGKQETNRSLRYSLRDGVAYSIMAGAGETYFSAFALFLKASAAQVGLLATLPPLIASFAQLFSAWLGHMLGNRKLIILVGAYLQALSWIPIVTLPMIFPDNAIPLLIVSVTLYYALSNLINPQWSSLMGDLVQERQRGRFFARRNRLMSVTNFMSLVSAGGVLHYFEQQGVAYYGFIVIFCAAIVARLASAHFLALMINPPGHVASLELPTGIDWWRRIRGSNFSRFALFFALMQFAVGIASPYFAVYMLRDLQFSYLQFMTITATSVLAQFLALNTWGRISDRFGNRLILLMSGCVVPLLPLAWVFSENFWYLMAIQVAAGFAWAGFSLSAGNFLYDLVPAEKRVTYLACHNVLAAVGVFLGATVGGIVELYFRQTLSDGEVLLGLGHAMLYVFLFSSVVRLLIVVVFLPRIREVRAPRRITARSLVLRATRSPALAGLIVEYSGGRQRKVQHQRQGTKHEPGNEDGETNSDGQKR